MILKLYKGEIIIKGNTSPEDINNCKITYEYELGTNHLVPRLILNDKVFNGDNITISLDFIKDKANMIVMLCDANQVIHYTYKGLFDFYRTFTIGDKQHIDVYKELVKAKNKIKELEENGEVI